MIRKDFPGGWYADALPSGEFAVLYSGSHLLTHLGKIPIPLPDDQPLYHRITNVGGFQIAGQGSKDGDSPTWWWSEAHGWVRQPTAIGVSPVIFDNLGHLHISDGSVGSQGYRYVAPNGTLITGDETYNGAGLGIGLSEFSFIDVKLFVGQSQDNTDSAWVWDVTQHRLLEPGPCRFIRATRSGDNVAIAIWKPNFGAVLYWLTVAELRALPIVPQAQPVPTPKPTPQPAPTPEPKPVSIPNQLSTVQRVRAKYPTPLGASHPLFLIDVAQATGAKLLKKDGGTHVTLPNGVNVSQDILVFSNGAECYDILGDGEGAATPGWGAKGAIAGTYIDVSGFAVPNPGTPAPTPGTPAPTPQPAPTVDLTPLQNELAALAVKCALLEGRVDALMALPLAKRGDVVEVTGSISVGDAFGGRKVTWTGKIK